MLKREREEEDDDGHVEKIADTSSALKKMNQQGEAYFEISNQRRVTIRRFKQMVLVDIREYYMKDGQPAPGNKGISLTEQQFEALLAVVDDVKKEIATLKVYK